MKKQLFKLMPQTKKDWVILGTIMLCAILMCVMTVPVFADVASDMVIKLVNLVCKIFLYIGILLAVWAVGMLILAFKNEDADSKSRAMMMLVVACMLMGVQALVTELGITALING